jgi:hypothetical protein
MIMSHPCFTPDCLNPHAGIRSGRNGVNIVRGLPAPIKRTEDNGLMGRSETHLRRQVIEIIRYRQR